MRIRLQERYNQSLYEGKPFNKGRKGSRKEKEGRKEREKERETEKLREKKGIRILNTMVKDYLRYVYSSSRWIM